MSHTSFKAFASDNYASVHPKVMDALVACNTAHAKAYGEDKYTARAKECFKERFGDIAEVFFVFGGTGANIVGLDSMTKPYQSILAWEKAHIIADECGAIEKITGSKIVPIRSESTKLSSDSLKNHLSRLGDVHHAQPAVISISQSNEYGVVYQIGEIRKLADFAHEHKMMLHVDGARIANAAASLSCSLKEMITDTKVDVLSFGGTKNGMMFGEAVVVLNPALKDCTAFYRKQNGQLPSKQRYVAAQFLAMFEDELWLACARHANQMAQRLFQQVSTCKNIEITQPVQANVIFARLSPTVIQKLMSQFKFYMWDELTHEVRWMTSFDTTEKDVDDFAKKIIELTA